MKSIPHSVLLFSTLAIVSDICSAKAVVRIYCDEKDIGTKVFINDREKGGCDDTLFLSPGQYKLRAVKTVNAEYEQTFKQDLNLFDGTVKRIDISLSKSKLTAAARKARQLAAQRQEEQAAQADLQAAQAGDIKAMKAVTQRYAEGNGLQKDADQAQIWHQNTKLAITKAQFKARLKIAQSGDIIAMGTVAQLYETGKGVESNNFEAQRWRQKAAAAKQDKINQEIAQKEREEAARIQAEKIRIQAEKMQIRRENQDALSELSYFENTNGHVKDARRTGGLLGTTMMYLSPISWASDFISSPKRTTQKRKLQNKLATLPSRWAKPNSMMAKAYRQQKTNNL